MNFEQQTEQFLSDIASRKSDPVRLNTLHVYRSLLNVRILPVIGGVELSDVGNKTVRALVASLTESGLSPATITLAVSLVKQIVSSATDEEGEQLYPRKWNTKFIDAPKVDPTAQKAPICPVPAITAALQTTSGDIRVLVALLAGTGLRVGEALSLTGNDWNPEAATLQVHSTLVDGHFQAETKTKAGTRTVDLDPKLNQLLHSLFANRESRTGRLFPASEPTYRRRIDALGIPGFHSLRRFRITHLQNQNTPNMLTKFWVGHAAGDVSERYVKMGAQIQERKNWSEKVGLGFQL
jgi:integrase